VHLVLYHTGKAKVEIPQAFLLPRCPEDLSTRCSHSRYLVVVADAEVPRAIAGRGLNNVCHDTTQNVAILQVDHTRRSRGTTPTSVGILIIDTTVRKDRVLQQERGVGLGLVAARVRTGKLHTPTAAGQTVVVVREPGLNGCGQREIPLCRDRSCGRRFETHPEPPVVVPPAAMAVSAWSTVIWKLRFPAPAVLQW
jgi:hypothetical protein